MKKLLIFLAGAAFGASAGWYYAKRRYEGIIDEEIKQVKQAYSFDRDSRREATTKETVKVMTVEEKPDIMKYARKLNENGYTEYSTTVAEAKPDSKGEEEPLFDNPSPYVISPDDFGSLDDYATMSLSYFADGVVADDDDYAIDNYEELIGDALDHFGEYEDDAVYVRNDVRHCDYEILMDQRDYSQVRRNYPPEREIPTITVHEEEEE